MRAPKEQHEIPQYLKDDIKRKEQIKELELRHNEIKISAIILVFSTIAFILFK